MGCDIHPYFERRNKQTGEWEPVWKPEPDPSWWHERIVNRIINEHEERGEVLITIDGKVIEMADVDAYSSLTDYFEAMPMEDVKRLYGDDPDLNLEWREHSSYDAAGKYVGGIRSRDYGFFSSLAGVRGDESEALFGDPRGLPKDVCPQIAREVEHYGLDGHTHSWLMVCDILEHPAMQERHPSKYKWLKDNIEDPANTRFVFFFDN